MLLCKTCLLLWLVNTFFITSTRQTLVSKCSSCFHFSLIEMTFLVTVTSVSDRNPFLFSGTCLICILFAKSICSANKRPSENVKQSLWVTETLRNEQIKEWMRFLEKQIFFMCVRFGTPRSHFCPADWLGFKNSPRFDFADAAAAAASHPLTAWRRRSDGKAMRTSTACSRMRRRAHSTRSSPPLAMKAGIHSTLPPRSRRRRRKRSFHSSVTRSWKARCTTEGFMVTRLVRRPTSWEYSSTGAKLHLKTPSKCLRKNHMTPLCWK